MEIKLNPQALEILGERKLLERINRVTEGTENVRYSVLAVKNLAGVLRLQITTHSESEQDAVVEVLENAGFNDQLIVDLEEVDEHGNVDCRLDFLSHPQFTSIYTLAPVPVVRRHAVKEDPGPDPSWVEWFSPPSKK